MCSISTVIKKSMIIFLQSMKCSTDIKDNEISLFLLTWQKFQDTLLVELGDDTTCDLKIIHSAHIRRDTHSIYLQRTYK